MTQLASRVWAVATAIGLTYGSYVVGGIVVLVVSTALAVVGVRVSTRPSLRLLLSTVLLQGVTFGGITIVYLKVRNLDYGFAPFTIPDRQDAVVILGGIVALIGLLLTASSVISSLGLKSAQNQVVEIGQQNPAVFLLLIPLSFLLIGPGEELLFRGLVQGTLREAIHPTPAVVLASALFASIHLFSLSGEGKLVYIGVAFVLALVLGATYEYTGNLTVPALVHGGYNAIQFAGAYVTTIGSI